MVSPASSSEVIKQYTLRAWLPTASCYSYPAATTLGSNNFSYTNYLTPSASPSCPYGQSLDLLPCPNDMDAILRIYMETIHPIFPALDYDNYQSMPARSAGKILLSLSICIAASVIPSSGQYFRHVAACPADFSLTISDAIKSSNMLVLVQDKLISIQSLSLLSLFKLFSGNRQESTDLLYHAISHAQAAGLHYDGHTTPQPKQASTRSLLCLFAIDTIHSACSRHPAQFRRCGFGSCLTSWIVEQEPCFQLFLRTIVLLERAVDISRTAGYGGWVGSFPSFEDLLGEVNTSIISVPLIATIEVLYHAVAIVAYPSSTSTSAHSSSWEADPRQALAASRITYIVGEEFDGQLTLLPVIPYAVGLSLRVSWNIMLRSKTLLFKTRARKQVLENCAILRSLGGVYSSASLMADLAERLVYEQDSKEESGENGKQNQEASYLRSDTSWGWAPEPTLQSIHCLMPSQPSFYSLDTHFSNPVSHLDILDQLDTDVAVVGGTPENS
ncbi:hypothetical protein BDV27DRAFT_140604 [Aspergillus caelatus]|uniref:Xylanolytic transcriptional activator regulatory domain-containing protein n=1 Tax=Aspergillus caelatus TaxID=61420 RepID=A0A5N7AME4_9EURO|nr:uncharacterized protein BDV27DRAFT_140604 [Aspergillus caelatus]KAE8370159.1 hypothetical protein BDV27DRAFT_140604 [Aspergillus caelatus]